MALTLNFVIHRGNLHQLDEMVALTEKIGPGRVEFAHVQYYGWAFANRERLLPTREQLDRSLEIMKSAEERLRGRTQSRIRRPGLLRKIPKPCMGGWGRKVILIKPDGDVLPCHAANVLPGMKFENVEERPLRQIWEQSEAFQKFRGEAWMPEPCRSCDRRDTGFRRVPLPGVSADAGRCRTDPVCSLSRSGHRGRDSSRRELRRARPCLTGICAARVAYRPEVSRGTPGSWAHRQRRRNWTRRAVCYL